MIQVHLVNNIIKKNRDNTATVNLIVVHNGSEHPHGGRWQCTSVPSAFRWHPLAIYTYANKTGRMHWLRYG